MKNTKQQPATKATFKSKQHRKPSCRNYIKGFERYRRKVGLNE